MCLSCIWEQEIPPDYWREAQSVHVSRITYHINHSIAAMLLHSVYSSSKISERESKKLFGLSLKLNKPHYLPLQKISYSYEGERSAILERKRGHLCFVHNMHLNCFFKPLAMKITEETVFMGRRSLSGLGHALHLVSPICPVFSLNSITNFSGWGALLCVCKCLQVYVSVTGTKGYSSYGR